MSTTYSVRIALVPKGEFSEENFYSRLDIVHYQKASYVCKSAHTGAWNDNNWTLLCEDGAKGEKGDASVNLVSATIDSNGELILTLSE